MRTVRLLDLKAEFALFEEDVRAAVNEVLASQQFIGGPAVEALERALAARLGVAHAIAIGTGTDAILCALMALGIGHDDEVIVPSFTFFATAGCVARVGAKPVFVDIEACSFNIDPARIERAITPRTRAIMPVHLFGQCADMDAIHAIAKRHKLFVIEDAAQAIDATHQGRKACGLGDVGCLSFYPTKNLGGFGEGGMALTNDPRLATTLRQLRNHGGVDRYVHERVGGNFRLDTMKAAILLRKLSWLDEFTRRRQSNAALYDRLLAGAGVTTPRVSPGNTHVYHQYSILCDRRDELMAHLKSRGVDTGIYYPIPLHIQKCFADLGYRRGDLPMTEATCERILSLPVQPMLTNEDIRYVADEIAAFQGLRAPSIAAAGASR